ncbi:hypothetical protein K1T71_001547 [Dendrolimus kikuchii]|uniref:Uncharacterized protein n=1 Tax=Dendrolimus kikuchii TaxID=765133 RepID=A0ACC1DJM3_9NEOP|nr:hypothetical protein K1T71_001547 [Dendrolimus kikuchii]
MKCVQCKMSFHDGVQCSSCKKDLDFGCAGISEANWRKLGNERRMTWKCQVCRYASSSPLNTSTSESASLELILSEIREMKVKVSDIPALIDDVRSIKGELKDLKKCCEFNSNMVEDFASKLSGFASKITEIEKSQDMLQAHETTITKLRAEISAYDQRSRLNNVEIKGVPVKKDENLFKIIDKISHVLNFIIPENQINYISRVPLFNSNDKSIIVCFLNRYIKEDFVAAARGKKTISTNDIGFLGTNTRIYINDHLNADSKQLLNKTRALAKEKNVKYVWIKHGKIHLRKDDTSKVFIISHEADLNKFA